jgi:hypothetical protein
MSFSEGLRNLESLEMAKKRDHKIMITAEAIEKVPYVTYKEIPEEEYTIIQMLAKKVLQISKDENDSNEVAITYSMDNAESTGDASQYFGVDLGDEHSADPMRDSYSYHLICGSTSCVVISLHNHPSISKISLIDVRFFLEHPTIKLLTVVTNMGNIFYLVKGKNFNIDTAIELFNEAVSANNKAVGLESLKEASEHFLKNCYNAGIIYEDR